MVLLVLVHPALPPGAARVGKSALRRRAWVPIARNSAEATRKAYPKCGAGRGVEDGDSDMTCCIVFGDPMKRVWMDEAMLSRILSALSVGLLVKWK